MLVPRKTQYGLRAIFELAMRGSQDPVKMADIAKAQAIPGRFLEVILSQLKQAGFVDSRRGSEGGHFLVRAPDSLTVGEVMRFLQGPVHPVGCFVANAEETCPLQENCVFLPMWKEVADAISAVYDRTTFQDLVDRAKAAIEKGPPGYTI